MAIQNSARACVAANPVHQSTGFKGPANYSNQMVSCDPEHLWLPLVWCFEHAHVVLASVLSSCLLVSQMYD